MESSKTAVRRRASGFSAFTGVVTTLVMSTIVFVAFLILPLVVLGLAALAYWVRTGTSKRPSTPAPAATGDAGALEAAASRPVYRFGTGV